MDTAFNINLSPTKAVHINVNPKYQRGSSLQLEKGADNAALLANPPSSSTSMEDIQNITMGSHAHSSATHKRLSDISIVSQDGSLKNVNMSRAAYAETRHSHALPPNSRFDNSKFLSEPRMGHHLRDNELATHLNGWLYKYGRSSRIKKLRYMRLRNKILSSHPDETNPPSWNIDLRHVSIRIQPEKCKIWIENNAFYVRLQAITPQDFEHWYHALQMASGDIKLYGRT
eukprot:CAMPEP_0184691736 /NCGR_PEP_ID=MMETSP0313-20130426/489_1 /TAXON_ID=2792 /ORGANISM="Porphyridium aerugineum, Strain SAG 1380-2" /LENGTH=228 /DNA_ID=CAMNT_0027149495 /DNA_START=331 /DNA_END=1017 /DNA_ORIENTATION=+